MGAVGALGGYVDGVLAVVGQRGERAALVRAALGGSWVPKIKQGEREKHERFRNQQVSRGIFFGVVLLRLSVGEKTTLGVGDAVFAHALQK